MTRSLPEFSRNGRWRIVNEYRSEANGKMHDLVWTIQEVETKMREFKSGKLDGAYGSEFVQEIRLDCCV